jgi:hypothetical protein
MKDVEFNETAVLFTELMINQLKEDARIARETEVRRAAMRPATYKGHCASLRGVFNSDVTIHCESAALTNLN